MSSPLTTSPTEITDFRAYEATPGISVIVLPDAPVFTHVAVSNDFVKVSGKKRKDVIGLGHFEVFPKSPDDPNFTGEQNLKASFEHIIRYKEPHELPVQRYDIPLEDGSFDERYWKIYNSPILGCDGEVAYIIHSAVDITRQVKEEQRNRKTIQLLVDNCVIGIMIYAPLRDEGGLITDFAIRQYNERYCQLTGFSHTDLKSLTLKGILKDRDESSDFTAFRKVAERGGLFEKEQFVPRTGRWISLAVTKHDDGIQVTLTDIDELKRSQEALKKEILFSRSILDASLNGIYVLKAIRSSEGKVVDFTCLLGNQRFKELTGLSIEEIIGKSFLEMFPHIRTNGFFDLLCQVIEGREPHRQTMYYAQSFQRWYDYMAVRLDKDSVVVTFQEVTQHREASMKLEHQKNLLNNILHHSPLGITVYNPVRDAAGSVVDFQCILANSAAEQFTGIPMADRLEKTVLAITPDLKETLLYKKAVTAIEEGENFRMQYYYAAIGKWLELSIVKMDDNHLINVFSDITQSKETQVQLEQSIADLKQSNMELEQYAYVASHDLQEPLRKIRFFNNMLSDKIDLQSDIGKYVSKIDASAKRMVELIRGLLDYSRISKSFGRFEKVHLKTVLKNVLSDYELLIEQKGVTVQANDLPSLDAIPLQMDQLFSNIIGNSLKFTRKEVPPCITIQSNALSPERKRELGQLDPDKAYVELTFQDNGIGFQQEYATKIFTIFQRLNEGALYGGYGIGMAVCKKIVDVHGGMIYAEGEPKKGAIFKVILPLEQ